VALFGIDLHTQASLYTSGDPSEFISEYSAVITCLDDTDEIKKVGRIRALRVHAGLACDARLSLFDVCDAHSSELAFLHHLLYAPDGYFFKDELTDEFEPASSDLLVIDYVVLNPRWRKLRLGLLAVRKFVDLVGGGVGLAVSEIAPLRADAHEALRVPADWLPDHTTEGAQKGAAVRLRRYFRQMGFRRLERTPYCALSLTKVNPTAAELLGRELLDE
jgi:hypothetical protein